MDTDKVPLYAGASLAVPVPAETNAAQLDQGHEPRPAHDSTAHGEDHQDKSGDAPTQPRAESDAPARQSSGETDGADSTPTPGTPMSKNQLKKLKRQQKWEGMRDDRKRRRKEKRQTKQAEKRASKAADSGDGTAVAAPPKEHILVPVSLIFDCAFEELMRETELISLSSQITRSYAANRAATRSTRIYISSWGGKLRHRYETLLTGQHKRWNNVFFVEDDFEAAAKQARSAMRGEEGGTIVDVLEAEEQPKERVDVLEAEEQPKERIEDGEDGEASEAKLGPQGGDVVYLTSDSPHTLTRLEPYTSYVIGGIVDKNREKGLCYKRAEERGIRTAKLPIGDYMVMASRQVLTTNHVVEIMLSWLETGDWATAFTNVIPKRKGGHLRGGGEGEEGSEGGEEKGEAEDKVDEEKEERCHGRGGWEGKSRR